MPLNNMKLKNSVINLVNLSGKIFPFYYKKYKCNIITFLIMNS